MVRRLATLGLLAMSGCGFSVSPPAERGITRAELEERCKEVGLVGDQLETNITIVEQSLAIGVSKAQMVAEASPFCDEFVAVVEQVFFEETGMTISTIERIETAGYCLDCRIGVIDFVYGD